jgi:hypothetical protein
MASELKNGKPTLPGGLSGRLVAGRDGADHIRARLASHDWWLFCTCDPDGTAFLSHLERTYYPGEANRDFELLVMPALAEGFGIIGLFLAKKSRLPADRLCREINERVGGQITAAQLRERDVLFPHTDVRVAAALTEFVSEFLTRRPRPEEN